MKYIIFLFFYSSVLIAQEPIITESDYVKVTYSLNQSISDKVKDQVYLYCGEKESQYIYKIPKKTYELENRMRFSNPYTNIVINYNNITDVIEEQRILEDGVPLYATWKNDIVWEITDEEGVLGGFRVRKAITDSFELEKDNPYYFGKAIAWFCPDIPISSGPGGYYGLPGLILELNYENQYQNYTFEDIKPVPDYQFEVLNKENLVEKEDVIYYEHKNQDKIKEIRKKHKKNKK